MSVQVVTVADRLPDRNREPYYRFDMFQKSMAAWGEAPTILGMHEPWGGLMTKPRRLRAWLRSGGCGEDTLIVCDAFDVVFTTRAGEVEKAYRAAWPETPIVFNAEKGLFPRGELAYAFGDVPGPWKFLNSGFMIAPPATILALLEAMWLDDIADDHKAHGDFDGGAGRWINPNDQGWYQLMYAAQVVPIEIDHQCRICQSLSSCTVDEFDVSGERIRNVATGQEPIVFHFNGSSKNDLMPVFLRKWGLE